MDFSATYLGLPLRSPLVVGASPFCDDPATCGALEEAGAGALVMRSLFAEQIPAARRLPVPPARFHPRVAPIAQFDFPSLREYQLSPAHYVRQLARLKKHVRIPVIASLNGPHLGAWAESARQFADAGADAIELNPYQLVTESALSSDEVEIEILQILRTVTATVQIPVALKLSPFHTSLAQFATAADLSGAAGLVLFNRFYQPDFDIDHLAILPQLRLSDSSELLLRLRWLAILSPKLCGSIACSGGVHRATDVVKAILAGAHCVQVVSTLLINGPGYLAELRRGVEAWMGDHNFASLDDFRGTLSLGCCPDPSAHERAGYIRILQGWRG
jgi:dihydroorotate dehydrogenase (fumarate)